MLCSALQSAGFELSYDAFLRKLSGFCFAGVTAQLTAIHGAKREPLRIPPRRR
jgi:hypothetical protein